MDVGDTVLIFVVKTTIAVVFHVSLLAMAVPSLLLLLPWAA